MIRIAAHREPQPHAADPTAAPILAKAASEIAAVMGSTSEPADLPHERDLSQTSLPTTLDPPGDVASPPPAPTIDTVLSALARGAASDGYASNSPHCVLNGPQARLQATIYQVLVDQGLQLPEQGYVYPWLLDQILASQRNGSAPQPNPAVR